MLDAFTAHASGILMSGAAWVTVEDSVHLAGGNELVYLPFSAKSRMENPGKVLMILIEVQKDSYLGEDDIIRPGNITSHGHGTNG
jgi:mannose-6-phosphate isomerase-like protein (cupin superfamily)